eukprot:4701481-Pyramimonas_sp.AAC.1
MHTWTKARRSCDEGLSACIDSGEALDKFLWQPVGRRFRKDGRARDVGVVFDRQAFHVSVRVSA